MLGKLGMIEAIVRNIMTDPIKPFTITGSARVFATLANPSDHVRAPTLFTEKFSSLGMDCVMVPIDVRAKDLPLMIEALRQQINFFGAAVTIPHKIELAQICDELGETAQLTGAVNAVRFDENRRLIGDNFDGKGFVAGLYGEGHQLAGKKILMLGGGGAARAVGLALAKEPIASLDIANRSRDKADWLAGRLVEVTGKQIINAIDSPPAASGQYDMVVNTTSLGLHQGDPLPMAVEGLAADCLVCDIIMIPARTDWMQAAEARGLKTHPGRHMLTYQMDLIAGFIGAW